jgi:hypothetical protein
MPQSLHNVERVPNHLVWAILTTLFCCLPLGIVSIVHAARVDDRRATGDLAGARESSAKAGFWALMSALAVPAGLLLWFLFVGLMAVLGAAQG